MNFFFSGLFWGILLILLGISLIFKHTFHIDIPLFRIVFALFIIYVGIHLLAGRQMFPRVFRDSLKDEDSIFSEKNFGEAKEANTYNTVFGKGSIRITDKTVGPLEINTVFGWTEIRIDPGVKTHTTCNGVFAGINLPDGSLISFGKGSYRSGSDLEGDPALIRCNAVFGRLDLIDAGAKTE